jgi:hypothetical protein
MALRAHRSASSVSCSMNVDRFALSLCWILDLFTHICSGEACREQFPCLAGIVAGRLRRIVSNLVSLVPAANGMQTILQTISEALMRKACMSGNLRSARRTCGESKSPVRLTNPRHICLVSSSTRRELLLKGGSIIAGTDKRPGRHCKRKHGVTLASTEQEPGEATAVPLTQTTCCVQAQCWRHRL